MATSTEIKKKVNKNKKNKKNTLKSQLDSLPPRRSIHKNITYFEIVNLECTRNSALIFRY